MPVREDSSLRLDEPTPRSLHDPVHCRWHCCSKCMDRTFRNQDAASVSRMLPSHTPHRILYLLNKSSSPSADMVARSYSFGAIAPTEPPALVSTHSLNSTFLPPLSAPKATRILRVWWWLPDVHFAGDGFGSAGFDEDHISMRSSVVFMA